jgi:hypothetical protein
MLLAILHQGVGAVAAITEAIDKIIGIHDLAVQRIIGGELGHPERIIVGVRKPMRALGNIFRRDKAIEAVSDQYGTGLSERVACFHGVVVIESRFPRRRWGVDHQPGIIKTDIREVVDIQQAS